MFEDTDNLAQQIESLVGKPQVIFLDLNIEPLDGYQACQVLRNHPQTQKARIIGITAHASPAEQNQMRESGFDGAISKPINHQSFPAQMQAILNNQKIWEIE